MRELVNQETEKVNIQLEDIHVIGFDMDFLDAMQGSIQDLGVGLPYGKYEAEFKGFKPTDDKQGCTFTFDIKGKGLYNITKSWRKDDRFVLTQEDVDRRFQSAQKVIKGLHAQNGIVKGMKLPSSDTLFNKTFTIASISMEFVNQEKDRVEVISCITTNPGFIRRIEAETGGTFISKIEDK